MPEGTSLLRSSVRPLEEQPPLARERFIVEDRPDDEAIPMDAVFVGGGPAGLAGAIELARLVRRDNETEGGLGEIEIGVLEKAGQLGEHSLSGPHSWDHSIDIGLRQRSRRSEHGSRMEETS